MLFVWWHRLKKFLFRPNKKNKKKHFLRILSVDTRPLLWSAPLILILSKSILRHTRLNDSVEQSLTGETDRSSTSQEITRILWNHKVHHRNHNTCLSHKPDQSSPCTSTKFLNTHFNILLRSYRAFLSFTVYYLTCR